jgi:hypothetical protein
MRALCRFTLAVMVLNCAVAAAQQELRLVLKVPNAVAMDGFPDTGYYILTSDNAVYHYADTSGELRFIRKFPLQGTGDAMDLTFVRADGQDSVVVTQWASKAQITVSGSRMNLGGVYRYSTEGKVLGEWQTRRVAAGVDYDPTRRLIYFSTADANEVYQADLAGGVPRFVCEVTGAMQLGPIALDTPNQVLYTADTNGRLFSVSLRTKRVTPLKPTFALVSALRLDAERGILFVADSVQKKIFAISLVGQSSRVISESRLLTSPSGLAQGQGDTLMIADLKSGSVFSTPLTPGAQALRRPAAPARVRVRARPN